MNDNRLVKQCCMMEYKLDEMDRTTWCTTFKNLLSRCGYIIFIKDKRQEIYIGDCKISM